MKKNLSTFLTATLSLLVLGAFAIIATAVAKPVWMVMQWIWSLHA